MAQCQSGAYHTYWTMDKVCVSITPDTVQSSSFAAPHMLYQQS